MLLDAEGDVDDVRTRFELVDQLREWLPWMTVMHLADTGGAMWRSLRGR
jgi:hypothetical protein